MDLTSDNLTERQQSLLSVCDPQAHIDPSTVPTTRDHGKSSEQSRHGMGVNFECKVPLQILDQQVHVLSSGMIQEARIS